MTGYITEINYDKLIEKSLKHVVVEALKIAERQGLPGENHFYITFKTTHPQVSMSEGLKNQYSNLVVANNYFSIDLSFNGIPQTLTIPYEAITYFGDPYAKFGLSFNSADEPEEAAGSLFAEEEEDAEEPKKASGGIATVVSIDAFRKKN